MSRANPLPFAAAVLLLLTAAGAASLHNIRNRYEMSRKMALEPSALQTALRSSWRVYL